MMDRILKQAAGLAMLAAWVGHVQAFSLLGQYKSWQVTAIGYNLPGDIGGPMTLAEGYRWNVPTIVYAFDQSFIAYFGPKGIESIEKAVAIFNDLPPASQITNDGSSLYIRGDRVPTDTKRINFQAQTLGMLDIKSTAMTMMLEEFGLAEPERYVWTLRARNTETIGGVTITNYTVIKLNYDPVTLLPSSYVNGALYSYQIFDPIRPINYADAEEFSVDPLAFAFSSVAGALLSSGEFYTGLTQDDVGGWRFLFHPNNFATEGLIAGVTRGTARGGVGSSPWVPITGLTNLLSNTNGLFPTIPGLTNATSTNLTNIVMQALRPGLDKITLERGNFDSLIGQMFITTTNQWDDRYVSNGLPVKQPLQRAVAQPDILFTSEDLGLVNNLIPVLTRRTATTAWINNDAINGVAGHGGPGNIVPQVTIAFSDQLPYFENSSPDFLDESTAFSGGIWGSFDGTTNAPIIFPTYLSLTLDDLANLTLRGGN
jgi:hypothetical protein